MTDTTAPRTAARYKPAKDLEEVHAALVRHASDGLLMAGHADAIGLAVHLASEYERLTRREAIEPLLALVRAAQRWLAIEDEPLMVEAGFVEAQWAEYEARLDAAVATTRDALASLPESIRTAAKKPE